MNQPLRDQSPPTAHPGPACPGNASPVVLEVVEVSKEYNTGGQTLLALEPVKLSVLAGEWVVLFGPSGCGKSTLLNLIAGFETPTTGEIRLEGRPVLKPGPDRLMMFQEHALFPWLNVVDNVMYGLKRQKRYRFKRRLRRERARELLRMVHLEEFGRAAVHELSGGMKQRAALARALAPDPKLLLIDEPFPALDTLVRAKLYGELQEIFTRTGKTIISVTHDPNEAVCLGDRVCVFTDRPGRIKAEVRVDLPRPREIADPRLAPFARLLLDQLEVRNA